MSFVTILLPKNQNIPNDRQFEVSLYDDMILIERQSNELWDYESTALTKEQALYLAGAIMGTYGITIKEDA